MRRLLIVFIIAFTLASLVYPSALIYSHVALPDTNDTRLLAYIIGQVQNNLLQHQPLYFGRFFAPYANTLTYSDLFLTSALLTLPLRLLIASPIAIFNIALLLGFTLTFITSYYLFKSLFKDSYSALFAAVLFNLSGFHLTYLPHLQMYSLWPVFLALLFFLRYCDSSRPLNLFLFFLSVTAQMAESIFPVYLIFFTISILIISNIKKINIRYLLLNTFYFLLLFLPLWFYLLFPYAVFHYSFPEAVRPIRDAAHFSLGIEEIFTKFHSQTFILLFLLSFLTKSSKKLNTYYSILATSLVLSLGPVLKIFGQTIKPLRSLGGGWPIPLPYAIFYYLLPGFNGFRTPSRFIILTALAATIIIVNRLKPFFNKLKSSTRFLVFVSLTLVLLLEAKTPRPGYAVDIRPPAVYEEVKRLPQNAVILELPILLWNDPHHEIESIHSLYSLEHGHRRLGGFSGFAPMAWIDLVQHLKAYGLDPGNLSALKSLGITHIVENNHLSSLP